MKRWAAVVALCAVAMLGIGPCPRVKCNSSCSNILDLCTYACPTGIAGFGGYKGAKAYCEENPDTAGCSNLPAF